MRQRHARSRAHSSGRRPSRSLAARSDHVGAPQVPWLPRANGGSRAARLPATCRQGVEPLRRWRRQPAATDNRRALASGNPLVATASALELPRVPLEDALALVLLYQRAGDGRFERAALRWHARACAEIPAISLASAALAEERSAR